MIKFEANNVTLYCDSCLRVLRTLEDCSIDAIVTDPPYGLNFMGAGWDQGVPPKKIWAECLRVLKPGGHLLAFAGTRTQHHMATAIENGGFEIRDLIAWVYSSGMPKTKHTLKPALEPITVARKPFSGSQKSNIEKHSVGGMNIEDSRVKSVPNEKGRCPTNLIHDGSEEVTSLFPEQAGKVGMIQHASGDKNVFDGFKGETDLQYDNSGTRDFGSAARFFYCAKANKKERGSFNDHPTVKPIKLMTYLCKLVCPDNGIVLDPFMGSGTTGLACIELRLKFVGIDYLEAWFDVAKKRILKKIEG